ncbi:MAG: hypothetical protein ACK4WF_07015 [Candidatus Brocadiales bacterium]
MRIKRKEMKTKMKRVSDLTVDELKTIVYDVIAEDLERWKETFAILSNKRLMKQIKQADEDWLAGKKGAYV